MTLTGLAVRNVLRNKFRTVLTILGVAVAVFTFVLLQTVVSSWKRGTEISRKNIVVTRQKVSFVFYLPLKYVEDIKQIPGVKQATPEVWFGGTDPKHESEVFATIAIDPNTFFDVDDETTITPQEKTALLANRRGAVVGDALATKLGWKVGDHVTLGSGKYPSTAENPWTFDIVGIYTSRSRAVDRSTFYLRYDYLNDSVPAEERNRISWIATRLSDGQDASETARRIDARFAETDVQTLSQDERTFRRQFLAGISAVLQGLNIVSLVIVIIMMLILGNTVAMGARERTSEYGALRAIGFMPRHIVAFIVGEATVTGILGGLVGIAIAVPVVQFFLSRFIEENMGSVFPYFRVDTTIVVTSLGVAALLGILAAMIPGFRAARLGIVDSLRHVA